jgi:hypothetical protein
MELMLTLLSQANDALYKHIKNLGQNELFNCMTFYFACHFSNLFEIDILEGFYDIVKYFSKF